MQFWQNQLNFAVWCSTAGCGVPLEDHLTANDPLMKSLFRFHAYYQIRRILDEIKAPLPQDRAWDATDNTCDLRAYERICNEFGVSPNSDWRVGGPNRGLGTIYLYTPGVGLNYYYPGTEYDPKYMSFKATDSYAEYVTDISYIKQEIPDTYF